MKIADLVEESEKEGKPAFVFLKCHGYNKTEYRSEYLRYAGQQRVTDDDLYNCEIDEALGELLDHFGYPGNSEAPTIWFASDHGSWAGESFRKPLRLPPRSGDCTRPCDLFQRWRQGGGQRIQHERDQKDADWRLAEHD